VAKFQHIKEILVRNFEHLINLASGEVARQFGLHVNDLRDACLSAPSHSVGNSFNSERGEFANYFDIGDSIEFLAESWPSTTETTAPNFNPVFVPDDPVDNPQSTGGRSPPAPSNTLWSCMPEQKTPPGIFGEKRGAPDALRRHRP